MADLDRGWALEAWAGVYHFEGISPDEAGRRIELRERVYVVETVSEDGDGETWLNKYFVAGLPAAIGMAAKLLGDLQESAEEITGIRLAETGEETTFLSVVEHFNDHIPPALSDDEAAALGEGKA